MTPSQVIVALRIAGYGLLGLASDVDRGRLSIAEVPARVLALVRRWL